MFNKSHIKKLIRAAGSTVYNEYAEPEKLLAECKQSPPPPKKTKKVKR